MSCKSTVTVAFLSPIFNERNVSMMPIGKKNFNANGTLCYRKTKGSNVNSTRCWILASYDGFPSHPFNLVRVRSGSAFRDPVIEQADRTSSSVLHCRFSLWCPNFHPPSASYRIFATCSAILNFSKSSFEMSNCNDILRMLKKNDTVNNSRRMEGYLLI